MIKYQRFKSIITNQSITYYKEIQFDLLFLKLIVF